MVIVAAMVSLWTSDLRGEYQMLGAVGAGAWWRRRPASSMSALLIVASGIIGTGWGIAASVGGALVPRHARAQRQA
ncbi:hypothetical protein ACFWHQ_02490 [Streptomyces sp. NPDC060334]|uniref:hypothetical protein n=1 Tax=Streptomyces sp. NPDC060334 TaxID=3347099 RepID=UPI003656DC0A